SGAWLQCEPLGASLLCDESDMNRASRPVVGPRVEQASPTLAARERRPCRQICPIQEQAKVHLIPGAHRCQVGGTRMLAWLKMSNTHGEGCWSRGFNRSGITKAFGPAENTCTYPFLSHGGISRSEPRAKKEGVAGGQLRLLSMGNGR